MQVLTWPRNLLRSLRRDRPACPAAPADDSGLKAYLERWLAGRHLSASERFDRLRTCGELLVPEYRFDWPQMAWWQDKQFNSYLERFGESDGMNSGRRWLLSQLLRLCAALPGDTAECGVYQGASSWLICQANRTRPGQPWHHLFDSFQGLSRPGVHDGSHWAEGNLACPLAVAQRNLAEFAQTRFYPGWIPERFAEVADQTFALVHIDVDLHEPTRLSLEFFYPRIQAGGILICDDYGFTTCPGATRAVDEFLSDKPEKMLAMPGGGGFLIKGVPTAPAALK